MRSVLFLEELDSALDPLVSLRLEVVLRGEWSTFDEEDDEEERIGEDAGEPVIFWSVAGDPPRASEDVLGVLVGDLDELLEGDFR